MIDIVSGVTLSSGQSDQLSRHVGLWLPSISFHFPAFAEAWTLEEICMTLTTDGHLCMNVQVCQSLFQSQYAVQAISVNGTFGTVQYGTA